ncbi:hypothetical protein HDU67_009036 [Dinochytrium kinnereticum]|nr:hypothetical protein HDU67_009036 [Dinochytrium kinnereticum]
MKKPMMTWFRKTEEKWEEQKKKAITVERSNKLGKCLRKWQEEVAISKTSSMQKCYEHEAMEGAATRISRQKLLKLAFRDWRYKTKTTIVERLRKERVQEIRADAFAAKCVPRRYLHLWIRYVAIVKDERWKEYRKQQLRNRVKELLEASPFEEALKHELEGYGRGSLLKINSLMNEGSLTDSTTSSSLFK